MAFKFADSIHYANYINKLLAEKGIMLSQIHKQNFALFFDWCKYQHVPNALQLSYKLYCEGLLELEDVIINKSSKNQEVFELCMEKGNSGLYFLKNKDLQIVYIGKSKNLINRSLSSAVQRDPANIKYVSFMFMPYCNSHILEPYYILQSKPYYNTEFLYEPINENEVITIDHHFEMSRDIDLHQSTPIASFCWGNMYQDIFGVEDGR